MDTYRIYRSSDIQTVITDSQFVSMRQDPARGLCCVGTGRTPAEIAHNALKGRLGKTCLDGQGREYVELFVDG